MLVSIGAYEICDGTLAGGVAVSELRLRGDRLFDSVVPVGEFNTTFFDRVTTTTDIVFTVKRTFSDQDVSETFLLELEQALPVSGTITITTTGPTPDTVTIPNGFLVDHSLVGEYGATTFHQYHIVGGPPV